TAAGARAALGIASRNEGVYACLGVHPHEAGGPEAGRLDELRELFSDARAVAGGETGLDYFRDYSPRDAQRPLFDAHPELATELRRSAWTRWRAADPGTARALAGFDGTVVLHCFSSPALLEPALERGWYVSFAGNVTYPKAPELRDAAARVAAARILAETD